MCVVPLLLMLVPLANANCLPLEQRFKIAQSSLELTKLTLDQSDACGGFVPAVFTQSFEAIDLLSEYKTSIMMEENWGDYKIEKLEEQLEIYFAISDNIDAIMDDLYKCPEAHYKVRENFKKWVSDGKSELIKEVSKISDPYYKCRLLSKPQIEESVMSVKDEQCGPSQPFVLKNYYTREQIGPLHLHGISSDYLVPIEAEGGFLVHGSQHLRTNSSEPTTMFHDGIMLKAWPDDTSWQMFYRLNGTEYNLLTSAHQLGEDLLALGIGGGTLAVQLQFDGCIEGRPAYVMLQSDCASAIGTVEGKHNK